MKPKSNKPAAPNAGIASQLIIEYHWPGVGEPERSSQTMPDTSPGDAPKRPITPSLFVERIKTPGHKKALPIGEAGKGLPRRRPYPVTSRKNRGAKVCPRPGILGSATELIGPKTKVEGVEDLLWSVAMLLELQPTY